MTDCRNTDRMQVRGKNTKFMYKIQPDEYRNHSEKKTDEAGIIMHTVQQIKRKFPKLKIAQFSGWTVCMVSTNRFFYLE